MVACYHPVYIFNRVSVCNHSYTKTNESNQIPCIPLRKYNRNRKWHPSSVPLYQELKQMDGIESISLSMSSVTLLLAS